MPANPDFDHPLQTVHKLFCLLHDYGKVSDTLGLYTHLTWLESACMAYVADVTTRVKGSSFEQGGHCCTQYFRVRIQGQGVYVGVVVWTVVAMATFACRCGT
jgi:hypothetical protein